MLLKLDNIGKIYDSDDIFTIGIRGVSLEFDYNEFVTVEGESGAGKSTLLNIIGANDTYEEGELYINGEETSHFGESDWEKYREKNVATIFQDFNIIENLTVLENIELALLRIEDKKKRRKIARDLIERVGLTQQINQKGSRLSGGEKQRTVIARALAKDAPIILADEPTGNLDVKASREVAALLKEVANDKLVIVVTHNPEFFVEYATRRIKMYDGGVAEDKHVVSPPLTQTSAKAETDVPDEDGSRFRNIKNVLHIGVLNYKSRPRFTMMMTLALFVCAITLLIVLSVLGKMLILPVRTTLDDVGVEGKVIVTAGGDKISADVADELAAATGAGFMFPDRALTEFSVTVPRGAGMLSEYKVICLYAPYVHNLSGNRAVLVLPLYAAEDAEDIANTFINAGIGVDSIETETSVNVTDVKLYLGYETLERYGRKIRAVNTSVKLGDDAATVFTFAVNSELLSGQINLINSSFWNVKGKTVVFSANEERAYTIIDDTRKSEKTDGLIAELSESDYEEMFASDESVSQISLYFDSDKRARDALSALNEKGYVGLLSSQKVYVHNAGDVFTTDILWYTALVAVSVLFGILISIIFIRSVKVYKADFTVYRTLGISGKTASKALYVQMALTFLPTLVLLPVASLIAAALPASGLSVISVGNYFFIEVMLLLIVELVAFGFNKNLNGQSIRKTLGRGSK